MEAAHNVLLADYASFIAAERGIKTFLQSIVDELWYQDLKHATSYYNMVTAHELISHLDTNCGGLHPSELISLPNEMGGYYATCAGIPEYIYAMERAQRKLLRGNIQMPDSTLLAIASTAVLGAQTFPRVTDDWEARPAATKTWTNWKTIYNAAHIARKRLLLATGGGEPLPHAAPAIHHDNPSAAPFDVNATTVRLDEYLDNLANAATQETTTITALATSLATLSAQMATVITSLATITTKLAAINSGTPSSAPAGNRGRNRGRNNNRPTNYVENGYCWTHGYRVSGNHSSATCSNKSEGHKDAATRANIMNGSTMNKGWDT